MVKKFLLTEGEQSEKKFFNKYENWEAALITAL